MTNHQSMHAADCCGCGPKHYEYEVWQDGMVKAGGREDDYDSAKSEANHYARMYANDGPVEVRIYEQRLLSTDQIQPKRRRYDPYGSLSEYGIFPECDAQPPADNEFMTLKRFIELELAKIEPQWTAEGKGSYWWGVKIGLETVLAKLCEMDGTVMVNAVPVAQAPRACTCHPDDRPDGPCRERYAASECQALAAQEQAANADDEVVFIDGVGAARSSVKSCRDGVQWIMVGDRVYWPLSESDAKRLHSACCGNGSFDGPASPAGEGERDWLAEAMDGLAEWRMDALEVGGVEHELRADAAIIRSWIDVANGPINREALADRLDRYANSAAELTAEIDKLRRELEEWKDVAEAHAIAADEAEEHAEDLAKSLAGLITWFPSADTYRRLGFDPEAPMRALQRAKLSIGSIGGLSNDHV
ncbi:MAG TPA: hypothetical protein VIK69_12015 [Methylophilaceae bacterium]